MSLKKLINIIIIFFCLLNFSEANELKIKVKINNEIITNIDIDNEKSYLIFLNPDLKKLTINNQESIAKNSLIKEIIKKKELTKYFDIKKDYDFIDNIEKDLFKRKGFDDKSKFIVFLNIQSSFESGSFSNFNIKNIKCAFK